jgi:hypothetical protein
MKFLANASSAKGQADFSNLTAYAPVNVDSVARLDSVLALTCRRPTPRIRSPLISPTGPRTVRPSRHGGTNGWSNENDGNRVPSIHARRERLRRCRQGRR